jgi:hypothetical protein
VLLAKAWQAHRQRASAGAEGDLMGWKDRSMVDRYAADMQEQRAYEAKRRRGDLY